MLPSCPRDAVHEALRKLDATAWAGRRDRIGALRAALRGKASGAVASAATLDMGPIDLPGPTGESNRLSLVPRGTVLCLGPDADSVLDQAVQALRSGNAVLAAAPGARKALASLMEAGLPAVALDGRIDPGMVGDLPVDVVAHVGGDAGLRSALARRDGPIVPLVTARIDPVAYAHERVVCIDTTAAGGNATLLAEAG